MSQLKRFDFDNPPTKTECFLMNTLEALTVVRVTITEKQARTDELLDAEHQAQEVMDDIRTRYKYILEKSIYIYGVNVGQ